MEEEDKILIVKYITGQASEKEISLVKYLIGRSKEHHEFYIQYYETWQQSLLCNASAIDADQAYAKFLVASNHETVTSRAVYTWRKLAVAAALILFCAFGLYLYSVRSGSESASQTLAENEIRVPKGATKKASLPDGTLIWINAGSVLRIEKGFGATSRNVYLDGEAYFDIAENDLPFIVRTNLHTIRDIGTIFNIKAYSDDLEFETAVIEGEVSIEGKLSLNSEKVETVSVKKEQVLRLNYARAEAGEQAQSVLTDLIETKVQKVNPSQLEVYTGWTENLLVFEGRTFQEISRIMERKYDVKIITKDENLKNYAYTGSFKNVDSVEKALKILKETTDINYEQQGRTITIWGNDHKNNKSL